MANESSLTQRIKAAMSKGNLSFNKMASIEGVEEGEKMEKAADPEAGQSGVVSDITAAEIKGPGENSNVTEVTPAVAEDPIGATSGATEALDAVAEKQLEIKQEPVTKEDLDMIDKAANAMRNVAAQIYNLATEDVQGAFQKQASAEDPTQLLVKMASEGNEAAQHMVDFIASYNLGVAKKANDLRKIAGDDASEEEVAAAEDALNAGALENPEGLEEAAEECCTEDGSCGDNCEAKGAEDAAIEEQLQAASAQIEAEANQAVQDVAQTLIEADPSITEEEALTAAQEAVADALETIDAQQAIGAGDENGFAIPDEAAAGAVEEMQKSASAFPLRDVLCQRFNTRLGLNPEAFAKRVFGR